MKMRFILCSIGLFITLSSCNSSNGSNAASCDNSVLISNSDYNNADSNIFDINSVFISDECFIVNISASGCDGETWVINLIDSENILESSPPQRNLRLTLLNQEACLAYITREISFDISDLQVEGGQVQLNLVNTDESFLYTY